LVYTPRHVIIDDFLGLDEHRDMLAYALANQQHFAAGTVTSNDAHYRKNLVIMDFHTTPHSVLIQNRLLTWFPYITQMLGMELFPLDSVESQLTASNDGHFFRVHADGGSDETKPRTLSCIYYFFREPRPFAGGALRLYDTWQQGEQRAPAASWQEIEPVSNRLVVFPSDSHHELMRIRCPSRQFGDSRFAVTNWLRRAAKPNPQATFGWGHMHCGVVPDDFCRHADQPA
jgi:Rps23 Pro-64 3,4-dihydroxylase Tpa1-like proline 4-hydroxylase